MEVLRRSWAQIWAWLDGMNRAEKALIVCLTVIAVAVVLYLVSWASAPERVPIGQFASGRVEEVQSRLASAGIDATIENRQVLVPVGQQTDALAILVQGDLLAEDPSAAFDELIRQQSPWATDKQGDRAYLVARQKVAAATIMRITGVRYANVMISLPDDRGFGQTHVRPSASATVQMHSGRLNKKLAESIASFVACTVAEMKPQDVVVIDAGSGQQFTIGDENDALPTEQLEIVQFLQEQKREQIERTLGYIPGVIVSVNVQTDNVRRHQEEQFDYAASEPIASEETVETTRRNIARQGEAGVRPNTGMDIAGSGGQGTEESHTETRSTFGEKQLVKRAQIVHTGLSTQQINVTVNVPRRYFVALWKAANRPAEGQAPAEPTDVDLEAIAQRELAKIEAQVAPLIAAEQTGIVAAHMIPDETLMPVMAGVAGASSIESLLNSEWAGPAGVTALALLSLALMLGMVKKATRPESLPSVEELAGVPPTLPQDDELVGEVDESEHTLAGLELDESELKSRRIAEQISEMVRSNPQEAGQILHRWVGSED